MNQGDFRVSGTNEFDFGFASSATSRSGYGRAAARPRLRRPKLRKRDELGYNPFRNHVEDECGRGKGSSVLGLTSDERLPTKLPNEFRKLNIRENNGPGLSGGAFTSNFEFRSLKSDDVHLPDQLRHLNLGKDKSDSFGFENVRSPFSGLNGSAEAMFSAKMEHVRIGDRVGVSATGGAGESLAHANLKNGINDEFKENMFFQGSGVSVPEASQISARPPTNLANGGSGLSSSDPPAVNPPASGFFYQHEANPVRRSKTIGGGDLVDVFQFTGNLENTPVINSGLNRKAKFVPKRRTGKNINLKQPKENVKPNVNSTEGTAFFKQELASARDESSQLESPQSYSPMDMSPYPEVRVKDQRSYEASITSEESRGQGSQYQPLEKNKNDKNGPVDEDLPYATQKLNIGEVGINVSGTNMDNIVACASEHIGEIPTEEAETESFKSAPNDLDSNIDSAPSASTRTCLSSNSVGDGTTHFYSVDNSEITDGTKFTFTASTSSREPVSVRRYKKINRRKQLDLYRSTASSKVSKSFSGGLQFKNLMHNNGITNSANSQAKTERESNTKASKEVINESCSTPAATTVAQETCEKWRLRGNLAYTNGDLSKAEEWYTRGVKSIPVNEKSKVCLKALMLCYSNRAATRMSMGRLREAVEDCKLAAEIDPTFLRAHMRAANCFLALGEVEDASKYFKYCLQSGIGVCAEKKILTEASEGLQKAQKAAECMNLPIESIQRGSCSNAENTLRLANEGLTISSYSEKLLEIKAEALFLMQKYSEVIHLCEDSLVFAERNGNSDEGVRKLFKDSNNDLLHGRIYFRLWRCRLTLKSYFFLGKLEEVLTVLGKNEALRKGSETLESLVPLVATARTLIQYKCAGNEAFQMGKYAEAVEHYSAALSFNVDSHPFAAICFCNRAAAYKALGKIIDAIADCNLAVTLERDYLKAISRRASLYESIRYYSQAASDMKRIVTLLMEQAGASHQSTSYEKSTKSSIPMDVRQAQLQLVKLEKQASKGIPLNFYLILGIESTASTAEIKKAYRLAALKHHPDKAGQILAKGNSGMNGSWKKIAEEIHRNADKLFKLIGEAYTVLSDPAQRSGYDDEEEIRDLMKKNRDPYFASRTHADAHNYPSEWTKSRKQWNSYRRSYGQ